MKTVKVLFCLLCFSTVKSQTVSDRLHSAMKIFLNDAQMKHAITSLYVVNTQTNEVVYALNEETGLAPASCQKVFTSIAAFDLLGKDYRFKTEIGYNGNIVNGILNGNIFITGYGDPTLASWRYAETKDSVILNKWMNAISNNNIKKIKGNCYLDNSKFIFNAMPGGWIWDDMGNYYGAGTWALNWHENQFDLTMQPGKYEGDSVKIIKTEPNLVNYTLKNFITTGKVGSGDNSYIYSSPYATTAFAEGTIPAQEKPFTISGSIPFPALQIKAALQKYFKLFNISFNQIKLSEEVAHNKPLHSQPIKIIYTNYSPTFDNINFHFLKRSINFYGETFIRTIALEKTGIGNFDSGINIVRRYWKERGIEKSALHIKDGSGLSPQNRVTTHALVTALQYAHQQNWFNFFYNALPEYNGMKLKSGTIGGAKSFAGYHTAKNATTYTIAIIVNNFDGSANEVVKKVFKVLDELK
ncbi:MAG: D-alanyl-D-alanine carboxypeptidase/D-alanyl-D-alanine-endopeptidase [Bacteroidetes bacterium]|nr:D-alanyl-D-alanine carboxypeptidase/D-alanyl-D-alanine-endopeptidase [Bacteroidota bacterium]MBS1650366.1 D-alanyl-D-alanine carboxypeptidase/D-alanyl-D-alanine-endopeptidase [Bacteroidota bacterium]